MISYCDSPRARMNSLSQLGSKVFRKSDNLNIHNFMTTEQTSSTVDPKLQNRLVRL